MFQKKLLKSGFVFSLVLAACSAPSTPIPLTPFITVYPTATPILPTATPPLPTPTPAPETSFVASVSASKYDQIRVYSEENVNYDGRANLRISYPFTENDLINQSIKKVADQFVNDFHQISDEQNKSYEEYVKAHPNDPPPPIITDYRMFFDVSSANARYIMFLFDYFQTTGGTSAQNSLIQIYNRKTGELIPISGLFKDKSYLDRLSQLSRASLMDRLDKKMAATTYDSDEVKKEQREIGTSQIQEGTEPKEDNFKTLIFDGSSAFTIRFDKYQVAPGVDGVIAISLPVSSIQDLVKPEMADIVGVTVLPAASPTPRPPTQTPQPPAATPQPSANLPAGEVNCAVEKCVALTFDDGPAAYTDHLLDILKENQVKATFFVVGRSAKIQPTTILRMAQEGHQIGNHTWDHPDLRTLSGEQVAQEFAQTDQLIAQITGQPPISIMRPPYGAINDQVKKIAGRPVILWALDPLDWKDRDSAIVTARMSAAQAGMIILGHDIHRTTVDAIPAVIQALRAKGFKFVTVNALFAPNALQANKTYTAR